FLLAVEGLLDALERGTSAARNDSSQTDSVLINLARLCSTGSNGFRADDALARWVVRPEALGAQLPPNFVPHDYIGRILSLVYAKRVTGEEAISLCRRLRAWRDRWPHDDPVAKAKGDRQITACEGFLGNG
ncbi:MAG TPA: hypothetical protein VFE14_00750, partial [Micromonosporaceae bacterium]|nr:hypothetical protein [Micromonosporaceae bacterium]